MRAAWVLVIVCAACVHAQPALHGPIRSLDALPRMAPRSLVVYKQGGGVEAYSAHDGGWLRVKTWRDASGYRLGGYADLSVTHVLVETPAGVEVYELGHWSQPVLTSAVTGIHKRGTSLTIRPFHAADARWLGMAIQEAGGAWRLFGTEDGHRWIPMALDGAPAPISDVVRIGAGGFALKGAAGWQLFRRAAAGWERFELPGVGPDVRTVEAFDGDRVIAVAPQAEGSERHWFAWDHDGWVPLAQAIPGAPSNPVAFRTVIADRVVAIRSGSADAFHDHYFARTNAGWKRLADVLPGAPADIDRCHAFADDRGLVVASRASLEQPVPAISVYWSDKDRWKAAGTTIPGLTAEAWDIVETDGAHAFAVRRDGDADPPFSWSWLVEGPRGWRALADVLPAGSHAGEVAKIDAAANAVSIGVEDDDASKPAVDEQVFLRRGDRFVRFADVFHADWTPAHLDTDGEAEALVRLVDSAENHHFLVERNGTWVDLGPELDR